MNIFALSGVFSPLAGAIAGAMAVKSPGVTWLMLGIAFGLGIGIALYFSALGLSSLLGRLCMTQRLNPGQWVASLMAVVLPAASPFAAWAFAIFLISGVLHL